MKRRSFSRVLVLFSVIVLCHLYLPAKHQEGPAMSSAIIHTPLITFTRGEMLRIEASISEEIEWMRIFFRYEGLPQFQVRNMDKEGNKTYIYSFDTSQLTSLEFEYYLAAKLADKEIYFPANAPAEKIKVSGESREPLPEIPPDLPSPEDEEKKFKLPLGVDGSIQAKLAEKEAIEGEKNITANGNIRVFHSVQGNLNVDLDSNFNYTNTAFEGEKNLDLSNMMVSISRNNHAFRAGDISLSESEYTVSGLGRRGMEYIYDNQKAYIHFFDVSSQQLKGFEGFGIPKASISILGGAFGYKFLNDKLAVKAIYIFGKDDPSQAINTEFSPFFESRKGNVVALTQEAILFQNKLNVKAEIGRSSYDEDLADDQEAVSDTAFNIGGNFSLGALNLGTRYAQVGRDYNTVGFQAFSNDRKSYESSVGIVYKKMNLTASYFTERDNVENDPLGYTTRSKNGNINLSVGLSNKVMLDLGYNSSKQKSFLDDMETSLEDSSTSEFRSTVNFMLNQGGSIAISLINSAVSSQNDPDIALSTVTLNLTGSFRYKETLTISPVVGYSIANRKFVLGDSETYNAFLTGEVNIVPQVFSMFISSSFNRVESFVLDKTNIFELGGGLNLHLAQLIKIGSLSFCLRGNYRNSKISGLFESDYRVLLQCDFSY